MLYNPLWKNPQTSPFDASLQDLIAWLETKDPTQTYDYPNSQECMLCQFLKSYKVKNVFVNSTDWGVREIDYPKHSLGYTKRLPDYFNEIAKGLSSDKSLPSWSFGAALLRARQYLPK